MMLLAMYMETFDHLVQALEDACAAAYDPRLRALVVFGAVARGTPRPNPDIDLLLVADGLPLGRRAWVLEFEAVD